MELIIVTVLLATPARSPVGIEEFPLDQKRLVFWNPFVEELLRCLFFGYLNFPIQVMVQILCFLIHPRNHQKVLGSYVS